MRRWRCRGHEIERDECGIEGDSSPPRQRVRQREERGQHRERHKEDETEPTKPGELIQLLSCQPRNHLTDVWVRGHRTTRRGASRFPQVALGQAASRCRHPAAKSYYEWSHHRPEQNPR